MIFRPCFLVPHFNHAQALPKTISGLQAFQLPILIIDDGSNIECLAVLDEVSRSPHVQVRRRAENCGKGATAVEGFFWARELGFSHVFQIDADGQHDQSVIPQFLAAAENAPYTLIAGCPVYDHSVPKARLYGRKITDFWVMIETWSGHIKDSMCGFRLYPLPVVCALAEQRVIAPRMGFDIDILVRLSWADVAMEFLPCKVVYPADGVSHFRGLRDNWQISVLHTRLFFGMLLRIPQLIAAKIRRDKIAGRKF